MRENRRISDNEYYVLNALMRKSLYGYAILKEVENMTEGKKRLSIATLYDTLHRLLKDGLIERDGDIEEVSGRIRKRYRINGTGEEAVRNRYEMMELLQGMTRLHVAGGET